MTDDIKQDLKIAWKAWETRPGNVAAVLDMEDVCQKAAAFLGTDTTKFRDKLVSMRRAGLPMDKVLDHVFSIQVAE